MPDVWGQNEREVEEMEAQLRPKVSLRIIGRGVDRLRTIDRWAAYDASYALGQLSLRRWRRPQDLRVRLAIEEARNALHELVNALNAHDQNRRRS